MSTKVPTRDDTKGNRAMPRVKIRDNQLTLPEELRRAFHVADEDYFEAAVVEDGIHLTPPREARRRAALADIRAAQAGVRYVGPEPRPSAEEEEAMIVAAAVAARAGYLVARGRDLLDLGSYEGITILTPEKFRGLLRAGAV